MNGSRNTAVVYVERPRVLYMCIHEFLNNKENRVFLDTGYFL